MQKFLRMILLVVFATMFATSIVSAQSVFPPLNGSVADSTGQLSVSDVQASIDRLARQTGATPIAFAYNNKNGMDPDTYEKQFMESNGFGNPDKHNLAPKIILIAIDYEDPGIKIYYGDAWVSALDPVIQDIQNQYVVASAGSDPTKAFVDGFDAIARAIDVYQHPPTAVPQQVTVEQHETIVDTAGIGIAIWKVARWVLLVGILALLIWAFYTYVWPEWKKRNKLIGQIMALRGPNSGNNVEVLRRLPTDMNQSTSMAQLQLVLGPEQPVRMKQWVEGYQAQQAVMLGIQKRGISLAAKRVGLFENFEHMEDTLEAYQTLDADRNRVIAWLASLDKEAASVQKMVAEAPGDVSKAKKALAAATEKYNDAVANSKFLPATDVATATLLKILLDAEGDLEAHRPISATEVAKHLTEQIGIFNAAVEAIVTGESALKSSAKQLALISKEHEKELPSVEDILRSPVKTLAKACAQLHDDDPYYDDARDTAVTVTTLCTNAVDTTKAIVRSIGLRDTRVEELEKLFKKGFRSTVETDLKEMTSDLPAANAALVKGDYAEAKRWSIELDGDSKRALETMQALEALYESNRSRIAALSKNVAKTDKQRVDVVKPKDDELRRKFEKGDWDNVAEHFAQATKILSTLFDDPNDEKDLTSRATKLNSMDVQDFKGSEAVIARMEVDLARVVRLLGELETQHQKAVDAKVHFKAILQKAQTKFEQAVAARDKNNKLIDASVDRLIIEAQKAAANALASEKAKVYTDVVAYCQDVIELSERALSSATKQISVINENIAAKERAKESARRAIAQAEDAIKRTTRAALQSRTTNALERAVSKMNEAARIETKALTLEDVQMAEGLAQCASRYTEACQAAQEAMNSLKQDVAEYESLLSQARSAINSASSAIRSAQRECSDSRAGSSGDAALSRAKSQLPQAPSEGDTREAIRRIIDAAESAESTAKRAESDAESEIAAYERRRREEDEERRRSSSSSSSSFGSGSSSSRGSFGSGGSSSRSGF